MTSDANPFAALSLIVAPAILTNACSVLIMSTSNRFARTVDRARERELTTTEERSLLLLRALRSRATWR